MEGYYDTNDDLQIYLFRHLFVGNECKVLLQPPYPEGDINGDDMELFKYYLSHRDTFLKDVMNLPELKYYVHYLVLMKTLSIESSCFLYRYNIILFNYNRYRKGIVLDSDSFYFIAIFSLIYEGRLKIQGDLYVTFDVIKKLIDDKNLKINVNNGKKLSKTFYFMLKDSDVDKNFLTIFAYDFTSNKISSSTSLLNKCLYHRLINVKEFKRLFYEFDSNQHSEKKLVKYINVYSRSLSDSLKILKILISKERKVLFNSTLVKHEIKNYIKYYFTDAKLVYSIRNKRNMFFVGNRKKNIMCTYSFLDSKLMAHNLPYYTNKDILSKSEVYQLTCLILSSDYKNKYFLVSNLQQGDRNRINYYLEKLDRERKSIISNLFELIYIISQRKESHEYLNSELKDIVENNTLDYLLYKILDTAEYVNTFGEDIISEIVFILNDISENKFIVKCQDKDYVRKVRNIVSVYKNYYNN